MADIKNYTCSGKKHDGESGCGCRYAKVNVADVKLTKINVGDGRSWLLWTCPNCSASSVVTPADSRYKLLAPIAPVTRWIEAPKDEKI
jgi:hypothetical protein